MPYFDVPLLVKTFTDIFKRRPKNYRISNVLPLQAGSVAETIVITGNYLEGVKQLHSYAPASQLVITNVKSTGSQEGTSVTADAHAPVGAVDMTGITLYGYTHGLEGNPTAFFAVQNAIDIKAAQTPRPHLHSVIQNFVDYRIPEAQRFTFTATSDVHSIYMTIVSNAGTEIHSVSSLDFVYTFKEAGKHTIYFQGRTNDGVYTDNTLTQPVNIYTRPTVSYINVYPDYQSMNLGLLLPPQDITFIGYTVTKYKVTGNKIECPVWQILHSTYPYNTGKWFTAYLFIELGYDMGGFQQPVNRIDVKSSWQGAPFYPHRLDNLKVYSPNLIQLAVTPVCAVQGELSLFITPYNSFNTKGITQEIILRITPHSTYFRKTAQGYASYPPPYIPGSISPSENLYGFPYYEKVVGQAVSLNTWASIVGQN